MKQVENQHIPRWFSAKKNQRLIRKLEHDRESVSTMYENAISLRDTAAREKDKLK